MQLKKDSIDELFDRLKGEFNTETPKINHQERFLEKLKGAKPIKRKNNWWKPLSIAASVVLVVSLFVGKSLTEKPELADISPQMEETQIYFTSLISQELEKIKGEENENTKKIIDDTLIQLQKIETDYKALKNELIKNGEDKRIIYAMITNLQTRIDLLKTVLEQIEEIKQLKNTSYENTII